MNSPVRSLDKPKNHAAYLRFGLKQNWQQLVFYTIVMLLACVLTSIIGVTNTLEYVTYSDPAVGGAELFRDIMLIFAVVSCVLGIFAGMTSTGYVNSRRAIHCYHSLPLTRDALYLEGSAVQALYYLAASVVSLLIGTLCIVSQLGMRGSSIGEGFLLILSGIGGYLLVFSLFQLSGTLTGTAVFRFIVAGIIAFLPVVVYLMLYSGVDTGMPNILVDYYLDYGFIRFLCPAFNLFYTFVTSFGDSVESRQLTLAFQLWNIASVYLTAAFYYLLGLWLHRKRRSELSESSLIWKKLTAVVKYPVIFVAGAGGAVFFRALFGSDISWMLFGSFCGLVLSFLLMNVLISRNSKSMFKGLPGLGITAVLVAVFLAVIPFDALHINNFMYDTDQVKKVTVHLNSLELELTEPAEIAAVMPYIQSAARESTGNGMTPVDAQFRDETEFWIDPAAVLNQNETAAKDQLTLAYSDRGMIADMENEKVLFFWMGGEKNRDDLYAYVEGSYAYADAEAKGVAETTAAYNPSYTITTEYSGDYSYDWTRLEISVYPKAGIPIHRYMRISEISANAAVYDEIAQTAGYKAQYAQFADISAGDLYQLSVGVLDENMSLLAGGNGIVPANVEPLQQRYNALLETLLDAAAQFTPDMADSPVIGDISLQTVEGNYVHCDLYAGMTPFWDAWLAFWEQAPDYINSPEGDLELSRSMRAYYDMLRYTNYSLYKDGADIFDWMSTFHADTYIIEANTGRALLVKDGQMAEVLENAASDFYGATNGQKDTRYMIVTRIYTADAIKEGVEAIAQKSGRVDGYNTYCFFRKDAVPQFVTEAFGE